MIGDQTIGKVSRNKKQVETAEQRQATKMLQYENGHRGIWAIYRFADMLFHTTVRVVRKSSSSPIASLTSSIFQSVMFIMVFYIMFAVFGRRTAAIRGDFLIFLMSGIFLFMTHVKTVGAVVSSEGPASPIMKHAPMTTFLAISSSALATLYLQLLSMVVILFITHVAINPVEIENPGEFFLAFLLAWFSGIAVGLVFLGIKPFSPGTARIATTIYSRANMIASGKMFAANNLPSAILPFFSWNPLFHTIDQARGAAFINYTPHVTSMWYPVYFSLAVLVIGMMGEFYARKFVSISWYSRR